MIAGAAAPADWLSFGAGVQSETCRSKLANEPTLDCGCSRRALSAFLLKCADGSSWLFNRLWLDADLAYCCPTFEVTGPLRQDGLARLAKMYRVPPTGPSWPAVVGPVDRRVRPRHSRHLRSELDPERASYFEHGFESRFRPWCQRLVKTFAA